MEEPRHVLAQLRRLDMNLLLTFDALMQARSATQAAHLLHKTQPAISRELGKLRRVLVDPLLVVSKGRLVPTERALELHACVHDALNRLEAALAPDRAFAPQQAQGVVNIGTGAHIELLLGAPLLERVRSQAPGLTVRFQSLHGEVDPQDLDSERMDIAIGLFNDMPPRFHHQTLFRDRRVCLLAQNHPMAGRRALTLDELPSLTWLAFANMHGKQSNFDRVLRPLHRSFRFSAYLSGFGITPYVLIESGYATTIPACVAQIHLQHFPLTTLALPAPLDEIEFVMAWSKRQHTSPLHAWVREQIVGILAERGLTPARQAPGDPNA